MITSKQLQQKADYLNKITGSPATALTQTDNSICWHVGHFYIDSENGKVALERVTNKRGGVTLPLIPYHTSKKELYAALCAFIAGIEFNKSKE